MRPPNRPTLPTPPNRTSQAGQVLFEQVLDSVYGHRAVLYGPGGIGKSTLACMAPGPVAFIDADESLEKLKPSLMAAGIPIPVKVPVKGYQPMREALGSSGWDKIKTIVMDTWPPIEGWVVAETLRAVKKDNNMPAHGIEDYGFGKGYRYAYERFLPLLSDIDIHIRAGRNVIIIAHDSMTKVPNPAGQDFIRWEPNMMHTNGASMRLRAKEWSDHVLFFSYDINVEKQAGDRQGVKVGKATGGGARILYTAEQPHFMAKSRTTQQAFSIEIGQNPWPEIFK